MTTERMTPEEHARAILAYDWTPHLWTHGGCCNPECAKDWTEMRAALVADPEKYEATTDGGWPRVGWREVCGVEMRRTWPYNHMVPSVLVTGWDGSHWEPLMSLSEIREKRVPLPPSRGDRGTETDR